MKKVRLTLASAALATVVLPLSGGCNRSDAPAEVQSPQALASTMQSLGEPLRPVAIPPSLRTIAFDDSLFGSPPVPTANQKPAKPRVAPTRLPPLRFPATDTTQLQGTQFDYTGRLQSPPTTGDGEYHTSPRDSGYQQDESRAPDLVLTAPSNSPTPAATPGTSYVPKPALATNQPTPAKLSQREFRGAAMPPPPLKKVVNALPSAQSSPLPVEREEWSQPPAMRADRQAERVAPPQVSPVPGEPAYATRFPPAPALEQAPGVAITPPAELPAIEVTPLNMPLPMEVDMNVVRHHARMLIERGTKIGERGALYSAKRDFLHALRMIAQAHDAQSGTQEHTKALQLALVTLEEAEDFSLEGPRSVDLRKVVQSHDTHLLKGDDLSRMTALQASQQYFAFAQEQLAFAGEREPVAAETLYRLGKTHAFIARESAETARSNAPLALAMQQAALMVDDQHAGAANELGVMLAKYGQWHDARSVLLHAIGIEPTAEKWQNLAVVHNKLGETQLAELAQREAGLASLEATSKGLAGNGRVRFVEPGEFAQVGHAHTAVQPNPIKQPAAEPPREASAWRWPWMK